MLEIHGLSLRGWQVVDLRIDLCSFFVVGAAHDQTFNINLIQALELALERASFAFRLAARLAALQNFHGPGLPMLGQGHLANDVGHFLLNVLGTNIGFLIAADTIFHRAIAVVARGAAFQELPVQFAITAIASQDPRQGIDPVADCDHGRRGARPAPGRLERTEFSPRPDSRVTARVDVRLVFDNTRIENVVEHGAYCVFGKLARAALAPQPVAFGVQMSGDFEIGMAAHTHLPGRSHACCLEFVQGQGEDHAPMANLRRRNALVAVGRVAIPKALFGPGFLANLGHLGKAFRIELRIRAELCKKLSAVWGGKINLLTDRADTYASRLKLFQGLKADDSVPGEAIDAKERDGVGPAGQCIAYHPLEICSLFYVFVRGFGLIDISTRDEAFDDFVYKARADFFLALHGVSQELVFTRHTGIEKPAKAFREASDHGVSFLSSA